MDSQELTKYVQTTVFLNSNDRYETNLFRPQIFNQVQRRLSASEIESTIIRPRGAETVEQIMSIFLNSNIRRGSLRYLEELLPEINNIVTRMVTEGRPITLTLPTLPFKDQSPLTTQQSMSAVDLGEYLMMAQLRTICESVQAVYPPGVRINLISDGVAYADICADGRRDEGAGYSQNCRQIIEEMALSEIISVTCLQALIDRDEEFYDVCHEVREKIIDIPELRPFIESLSRGMLLNSIPPAAFADAEVLSRYTNIPIAEWPRELFETMTERSIEYISLLTTLRIRNTVLRAFPGSLRCTVQLKKASQLPLHLVNQHCVIAPYNGVPLVNASKFRNNRSLRRSARIVRFADLQDYPKCTSDRFTSHWTGTLLRTLSGLSRSLCSWHSDGRFSFLSLNNHYPGG